VLRRSLCSALGLTLLLGLLAVTPRAGADDLETARQRANEAAADLADAETELGELDADIQSLEARAAEAKATLDRLRSAVRGVVVQRFINSDATRFTYADDDLNTQARAEALSKYATQGNQDDIDEYTAAAEDLDVATQALAEKRDAQKAAIKELDELRDALEREFERLEALERQRQEAERKRREAAARRAAAAPRPGWSARCRARWRSATPGARPAPAGGRTRASTCWRRWAPPPWRR
jgi:peptidoglycan hydrolase CwlO-like protein